MKKTVELNYLTPLEFVATYARKELIGERDSLEEEAKMPIIEIISKISQEDYFDLLEAFDRFAPEVGYLYCGEHDVFHEYEKCPFCQLDICIDY